MRVNDVHVTKNYKRSFLDAISAGPTRIFLCSPFIGSLPIREYPTVFKFCRFLLRRGVQEIELITRRPGADADHITGDEAKHLASEGVDLKFRLKPHLHAKVYYFEYRFGNFTAFIGSSNFTKGGFDRNHEVMAEINGTGKHTSCHREMERLRGQGTLTYKSWLRQEQPMEDNEKE